MFKTICDLLLIFNGIFIFVSSVTTNPLSETVLGTLGLYLAAQTIYFSCRSGIKQGPSAKEG